MQFIVRTELFKEINSKLYYNITSLIIYTVNKQITHFQLAEYIKKIIKMDSQKNRNYLTLTREINAKNNLYGYLFQIFTCQGSLKVSINQRFRIFYYKIWIKKYFLGFQFFQTMKQDISLRNKLFPNILFVFNKEEIKDRKILVSQLSITGQYELKLFIDHNNYKLQITKQMQQQLKAQLKATKEYCQQIQQHFKNNLLVIEEREQEIEEMSHQVETLQQENKNIREQIQHMHDQHDMQTRLIRNEYITKLQQKERQTQEVLLLMQTRTRKQIQQANHKGNQEIKSLKNQLLDREESNHRIIHENSKHIEMIRELKSQLLDFQSQIQKLTAQKNTFNNKMALHEQELQGIKACNQNWQQNLKNKLKQSQKERQNLQEQISELKLAYKQKIKKQKEQFNKKMLHQGQEKQAFSRQMIHENKQLKYKHENLSFQHKNITKELEMIKEQKEKLQRQMIKLRENERKTNFEKNQKEYDYILKMFEQEKRDLKNQIDLSHEDKKRMKDQFDQINAKRQNGQKIIEKLKYQLINKSKETDQLKKDMRKNKIQFEGKLREIDALRLIPNKSVGIDMIQSAKIDNDYSKLFSEDIGPIDERFFMENSPYKSPKNKNMSMFNQNRQAQLMKKISQLQLEMQQYKNLTKQLKEEAENMKKTFDGEKNREINIYKDKANLYWEKCNDKEQQFMDLKEHYTELKTNYSEVNSQLKKLKQNESHNRDQIQESVALKQRIKKLEDQRQRMDKELDMVKNERDMLEDVATQLKASYNSLKGFLDFKQNESRYSEEEMSHIPHNEQDVTEPIYEMRPQEQHHYERNKKVPKKLHDLIRQKKMFSISGKKVPLQQRTTEVRLSHIGTDSQKQILEKIKIKNKTPPKVVNYAELKKEKQKKASLLETASQKQVYERLKNRQNQNSRQIPSPQRAINFLQLREQYQKELENKY